MKAKGVHYIPSPIRDACADPGPRLKDQLFALQCGVNPVVHRCWCILLLTREIEQAERSGNIHRTAFVASQLTQLATLVKLRDVERLAKMGKLMAQGRPPKATKKEILSRYDECVRDHPGVNAAREVASQFELTTGRVYQIVRSCPK